MSFFNDQWTHVSGMARDTSRDVAVMATRPVHDAPCYVRSQHQILPVQVAAVLSASSPRQRDPFRLHFVEGQASMYRLSTSRVISVNRRTGVFTMLPDWWVEAQRASAPFVLFPLHRRAWPAVPLLNAVLVGVVGHLQPVLKVLVLVVL